VVPALNIGEQLRARREQLGRSIEEVHRRTRISSSVLQAMEADDFSGFPNPVYARAFLRDYARDLQLDEEPLSEELDRRLAPPPPPEHVHSLKQRSRRGARRPLPVRPALFLGVVCVVAVIAGLIAGYVYVRGSGRRHAKVSGPPSQPAATAPATTAPGTAAPGAAVAPPGSAVRVPPGIVRVRLRTSERVWVRVKEDGKSIISGTLESGVIREFRSPRQISIRAGNAGGLWVTVNGGPEARLGSPGQPVSKVYTPASAPAPGKAPS